VGALGFGELRVTAADGSVKRWYVEGGVAEVSAAGRETRVTVLAERVVAPEKIDAAAVEQALAEAVASVPEDEAAELAREAAIRSAQARLRLARGGAAAHVAH
jgi:F0F1-type ATP synthase epsilon subunit